MVLTIKRRLKEEMNLRKQTVLSLVMVIFLAVGVMAVQPFGATPTEVKPSERAPIDAAGNHTALAGNVTEIDIFGYSPTQTWQGYYGNVSGTIQLADALDHVMYNWSLASPEGEVYASENGSIDWTQIQCFNFTATGTKTGEILADYGNTNQNGMNLTQIEALYNISWDDVDGVNETFSLAGTHESGGGFHHDMFYTNNLQFTAGECLSTTVFDSAGEATDGHFQEVLLYEPTGDSIIFASILDEEDVNGFDGNGTIDEFHDFEMLVLEDGHGTDRAERTYFFYVD